MWFSGFIGELQKQLMQHFGAEKLADLETLVPNGDYIFEVGGKDYNVSIIDDRFWIEPKEFNPIIATRINGEQN